MVDKNLVKAHFSKASLTYDNYATIQKIMARELIKLCPDSRSVLEIGCATGFFTNLLKDISTNLTACDISSKMVEIAKKRVKSAKFIVADAEELNLNGFDLIASNATFQWFNRPKDTIKRFYNMLNSNGVLAFSTFTHNTFCEINSAFNIKSCNQDIKRVQNFLTKDEIEQILVEANFKDIKVKSFTHKLYFNSIKELLSSIKEVGASNATNNLYIGKECYKEFLQTYQNRFCKNGKVYCTYEITIAFARR